MSTRPTRIEDRPEGIVAWGLPDGRRLVAVAPMDAVDAADGLLGELSFHAASVAPGEVREAAGQSWPVMLRGTRDVVIAGDRLVDGSASSALVFSARLRALQMAIHQAVGAHVQPVAPTHYVRVVDDALHDSMVVCVRKPDDAPFSGWQIVPAVEDWASRRAGEYSVLELRPLRPHWLAVLSLPAGSSCTIVGSSLSRVRLPSGVEVKQLPPLDSIAFSGTERRFDDWDSSGFRVPLGWTRAGVSSRGVTFRVDVDGVPLVVHAQPPDFMEEAFFLDEAAAAFPPAPSAAEWAARCDRKCVMVSSGVEEHVFELDEPVTAVSLAPPWLVVDQGRFLAVMRLSAMASRDVVRMGGEVFARRVKL